MHCRIWPGSRHCRPGHEAKHNSGEHRMVAQVSSRNTWRAPCKPSHDWLSLCMATSSPFLLAVFSMIPSFSQMPWSAHTFNVWCRRALRSPSGSDAHDDRTPTDASPIRYQHLRSLLVLIPLPRVHQASISLLCRRPPDSWSVVASNVACFRWF